MSLENLNWENIIAVALPVGVLSMIAILQGYARLSYFLEKRHARKRLLEVAE